MLSQDEFCLYEGRVVYAVGPVQQQHHVSVVVHRDVDPARLDGLVQYEGQATETDGAPAAERMSRGRMVYVPPYWAHRSVNTGDGEPLVSFCVYPAEAGHNYGDIETEGFPQRVFHDPVGQASMLGASGADHAGTECAVGVDDDHLGHGGADVYACEVHAISLRADVVVSG